MTIKIDDQEFRDVAQAVYRFNDLCTYSVDVIDANMRMSAESLAREGEGYMSTLGYVLSLFDHPDGGKGVKASVAVSILANAKR